MLNDAQQRIRDQLEALAKIDDELDEIDATEDAWNQARRELQKRRIAITNDLKLAHAGAGRPREAVHVGHRLIVFDAGFAMVTTYRVLTPSAFALMACPGPDDEHDVPPVKIAGVAQPMGLLVPAPDRQGV